MEISSIGLNGLRAAELQFHGAATQIAGSAAGAGSSGSVDLSSAAVSLSSAKESYSTNLKVIEAGDQMTKQALNLMA